MSFILDALKKSEQQRRQAGGVPDLQTPEPPAARPSRRSRLWVALLTAALLLNALLLLWLLRPWHAELPESSSELVAAPLAENRPVVSPEPAAPAPAPIVAPAPAPIPTPAPAPAGWEELPASPPSRVATRQAGEEGERSAARPVTRPVAIPRWIDLATEVRQNLPEVSITLHYYTSDPAARMARINNRMLREGETVGGDLILETITPSEVILRSGDLRFRLGSF